MDQRTTTALAERDADRRQVERLEREIAGVGARLKETYDRVRTALDAEQYVQEQTRLSAQQEQTRLSAQQEQTRLSAQVERLGEQVRQLAGQYAQEQTQLAGQVATLTDASNGVTRELSELFR